MPDHNFGPLLSFNDVEQEVRDHYALWMDTWLSARERHVGITAGTIARPRSYVIKQSFNTVPGEEQTPLVIVVSDGFVNPTDRHGDEHHDVYMRFGIAVVVMSNESNAVRELAGHYQVAVTGILLKHKKIADHIFMDEWRDLRIEDIDEEAIGRSMAAVRLEATYKVLDF